MMMMMRAIRRARDCGASSTTLLKRRGASIRKLQQQSRFIHSGELSSDQVTSYRRDGFIVLEDFITKQECANFKQSALRTVHNYFNEERVEKPSIFTTVQQERQSDEYFLNSGDKVRCFYESDAFRDGALRRDIPPEQTINKIGHGMHELDVTWWKFADSSRVVNLCASLGVGTPRVAQSMYIFKQPRIGGKVGAHQDSTFLFTNPLSTFGIWVAIEDAHEDNGCLWGVPGSHRNGIYNRFVRDATGKGTQFEPANEHEFSLTGAVPLPVRKCTAVILDGSFVHYSNDNRSNISRHALTLHLIDGAADYPANNWLQREDGLPFMRPTGRGDNSDVIQVSR